MQIYAGEALESNHIILSVGVSCGAASIRLLCSQEVFKQTDVIVRTSWTSVEGHFSLTPVHHLN